MGAKITTFCSAKGGSGKTAISVALACLAVEMGKRVLLVDVDAATNGMTLLLLKNVAETKKTRLVSGLFDKEIAKPIMVRENLDFIPSSSRMEPTNLVDAVKVKQRINYVIRKFSDKYDLIIFDTEAGIEQSTCYAINVSSKAVIVTEFDPLSASGVERLKSSFADVWPRGNTYIIVNKMLPEFAKIQRDYFTAWNHLPPIPFDFEVMRSYAHAEIPWNTEELAQFTKSIARMSYELLPEYREDINTWLNQKTEEFKQPTIKEYKEMQLKLEEAMEKLARIRTGMKTGARVWLRPVERLSIFTAIGIGIILILSSVIFTIFKADVWLIPLLGTGFGTLAFVAAFLSYKRSRQKEKLMLKEERMSLMARELEIQIERLLQKKYQLESLLSSETKDKFFDN